MLRKSFSEQNKKKEVKNPASMEQEQVVHGSISSLGFTPLS